MKPGIAFISDEANAVISLLDKIMAGMHIMNEDWQVLFDTEGYRRLKARKISISNLFTDDDH